MAVDRAGDHVVPARVELHRPVQAVADRGDPVPGDRDVCDGGELRRDDEAAGNDEVVAHAAVL